MSAFPSLPSLTLFRGDTRPIRFQITDQDGAIYDVTGWTFTITFASQKAPADESTQTGQIAASMSDAANGWVSFPRDALNLAVGTHFYDVQAADASGKTLTMGVGSCRVIQDITKSVP